MATGQGIGFARRVPAAVCAALLAGCAAFNGAWMTLIDGERGLEHFVRVGDANWRALDGVVEATQGGRAAAYLVSRDVYADFELRAEFWASEDANSGVLLRCQDPRRPTAESCYEINIFDQRPDATYATGAIVGVAAVAQPAPRTGGRWNTLEISARGSRLAVKLNGRTTAQAEDPRFGSGPIALQWGRGTIRFRALRLRPL